MSKGPSDITKRGGRTDVDRFLEKVAAMPTVRRAQARGRLLFALDATLSRQPTWDRACQIQAQMFAETAALGGLEIQMAYFRGLGEFRATRWLADSGAVARAMSGVSCRGGLTQIGRVLRLATRETKQQPIQALVYIGDCVEEDIDGLCALAGDLGLLGVRAFMFHEGDDPDAARLFQEVARLTKGAYSRFDASSARQLRDLLRAVAVFAAGGYAALRDYGKSQGTPVRKLIGQLK
ncbi:MAG: hypothetical protein ACE5EM_05225 [Sphingomonadales bacterium]